MAEFLIYFYRAFCQRFNRLLCRGFLRYANDICLIYSMGGVFVLDRNSEPDKDLNRCSIHNSSLIRGELLMEQLDCCQTDEGLLPGQGQPWGYSTQVHARAHLPFSLLQGL